MVSTSLNRSRVHTILLSPRCIDNKIKSHIKLFKPTRTQSNGLNYCLNIAAEHKQNSYVNKEISSTHSPGRLRLVPLPRRLAPPRPLLISLSFFSLFSLFSLLSVEVTSFPRLFFFPTVSQEVCKITEDNHTADFNAVSFYITHIFFKFAYIVVESLLLMKDI